MKTLLFALLLSSSVSHAARFVVEAKHKLSAQELKSIKGIKPFANIDHPYFSRLYTVSGSNKTDLEKQAWVKNVEDTTELSKLSLEPSPNPDRIVNDLLFPYQWSLLNQGQTYIREKDDIHNLPLIGKTGKDVGWKSIYNKIPKERRTIVAVLDSGIDLSHPDLEGSLWKNEKECGKDPKIDNDKNELPGDCDGWNFTEDSTTDAAKNLEDFDGHGSHVAGIIAAANNGSGIVGVNPNALIMPIKVMKDANSRSDIASSQSFAQGIIYATNMGAKIINMSFGWPRSLETKHLREAVTYALSQNVILVAAAGNNNSSEPLFPCAYDGVICAAASTLDGSFAGFSNYGGHVDGVAPGEGILSLYPRMFEPDYFSVPGYDIKSGTSQSAPLIAGLISILKAQKPDLTIDDVFARIYMAGQNSDKKKYVLGGDVSWESLSKDVTTSIVRPILKRVRQLVLTGKNLNGRIVVPVRNYGLEASDVQIKVESLTDGIEFLNNSQSIEVLRSSEVKDLAFSLKIASLEAESNLVMKVTVTSSEGEFSFFNNIPVVRDIRSEVEFKKSTFSFVDKVQPIGNVEDNKVLTYLKPVESYGQSGVVEYHTRRVDTKNKKLEIVLYTRSGNTLKEAPKPIVLEKFSSLVNFIRVDMNLDGEEDYMIQTVNEDEKGKFFQFSFFNKKMAPLWEKFPSARVSVDLLLRDMNKMNFIKINHAELGQIMVPTFFTEGQIPKVDQKQDFYGRWDGGKENRLYYLEPMLQEMKLRIRTFVTNPWKDGLKKQLNSKWFETILIENILPVSVSDAKKGEVRLILSIGESTKRQIFIATFDGKNGVLGSALPQLVIQTEGIHKVLGVSPVGLDSVGESYLNVYDRSRSKIVTTKDNAQSSQLNYTHISETDLIAGQLASFENGKNRLSILQTRDELVSLSTINGKVTKSFRPKLRYSYYSQKVLTEMYTPVVYKRAGQQAPALFVDSTAVTANRVYLFEEQGGKLVSSIKNSLVVPANCRAIDPVFSETSNSHEFVFFCLEEKNWVMRTYEMN